MQIDIDLSLGKQSPVAPFSVDEGPFCVSPGPDCKRYLQLIKRYSIRELHQETENLAEPSSLPTLD